MRDCRSNRIRFPEQEHLPTAAARFGFTPDCALISLVFVKETVVVPRDSHLIAVNIESIQCAIQLLSAFNYTPPVLPALDRGNPHVSVLSADPLRWHGEYGMILRLRRSCFRSTRDWKMCGKGQTVAPGPRIQGRGRQECFRRAVSNNIRDQRISNQCAE